MEDKYIQTAQRLRLLFVEDDDTSRELMQMILEEYFSEIVVAKDGEDGLKKFHEGRIDLILTDINMPKMNGFEMIEQIRAINREIPVLILSANSDTEHLVHAIELNISGYVLKPINVAQMERELQKIIQTLALKEEIKERSHLLEEYQEVVDAGLIVSKTDLNGVITYVNDNFCTISGFSREELLQKPHSIVRHPDNPKDIYTDLWNTISVEKKLWSGVIKNRKKSGGSYYVKSYVKPILDTNGNILEYIALRNDITEVMNPEKQLRNCLSNKKESVLLYMKLDEFSMVKELFDDSIIEMIENTLVKKISTYLPFAISTPKVFQLRNGTFASILDGELFEKNKNEMLHKIHDMIHTIKKDVINLGEFEYNVSIVASLSYGNDKRIENAILGTKKLLNDGGCLLIANDLVQKEEDIIKNNMDTLIMIQKALDNDKILSYFQPIVNNKTAQTVKYESLVRLEDQTGKILSPYFFLDTAKKGRYYTHITQQVLKNSFDALQKIDTEISINLSALDIENMEINRYIIELLKQNKSNASRLVFELLEDESVKNRETIIEFIQKVKAYGVKIAIDDFGSGYSNYERLLEYQPDILKIDGSLIKNIQTDDYSLSIVKSIVTFAKEQNFETVAEFVENENIFNILKALGVNYSQGYYFSIPKPLKEL